MACGTSHGMVWDVPQDGLGCPCAPQARKKLPILLPSIASMYNYLLAVAAAGACACLLVRMSKKMLAAAAAGAYARLLLLVRMSKKCWRWLQQARMHAYWFGCQKNAGGGCGRHVCTPTGSDVKKMLAAAAAGAYARLLVRMSKKCWRRLRRARMHAYWFGAQKNAGGGCSGPDHRLEPCKQRGHPTTEGHPTLSAWDVPAPVGPPTLSAWDVPTPVGPPISLCGMSHPMRDVPPCQPSPEGRPTSTHHPRDAPPIKYGWHGASYS
ncbi:hypothetical protein FB451DRAFT_1168505 [Mycena latifolia]|nr:hypothetical protein FB451DRAFT_1168505 [Mycena latifolia]